MNKPVDKDSLKLNQPKRTPGHPTKSHIVKTKVDGKEKIIRFGQQGASTAGKPKEGESDRMTAKRASFKARHSANIAKGPSSAAYWANKVKWADGGSVRTHYAEGDSVQATPQQPVLGSIANFLKKSYSPERTQQAQGIAEFFDIPALARTVERMSYGEPITNVGKANVPMLPDDTAAAAMLVGPTAGPLAKYAKRVGTNLVQTAPFVAKDIVQSMTAPTRPYVIKPEKGGNWLAGSIEEAVGPLKTGTLNETGLRNLAERAGVDVAENVRARQGTSIALNKWLDTKFSNYIKNEMGTPEDSVRALAERNILHVDPAQLNYDLSYYGKYKRPGQQLLAKSNAAKLWEGTSDNVLSSTPAGSMENLMAAPRYAKSLEENPWLRKVPPETPVYQIAQDEYVDDLGFRHLIDELHNAVDPNSTLPANLRLTPGQLDKVTMSQAVERVSKINDWRAAQAAEAEKTSMIENLTATPRLQDPTVQLSFVKEPGMTWVDIPATTDKKANKLCTTIGKQAGWCTQESGLAETYGSGNNRLTTMLDAEGRPHVQAKITQQSEELRKANFLGQLTSEQYDQVLKGDPQQAKAIYEEWSSRNPLSLNISEIKPVGNYFDSKRALEYEKRDPQYRAKITDSVLKFLNAGDWGKVKDLDIYNIVDLRDPSAVQRTLKDVLNYDLPHERVKKFNEAVELNPEANRFMSFDEFKKFVGSDWAGLAAGGSVSVYDSDKIDEIINGFDDPQGYAEGGTVRMGKSGDVEDTLDTFVAPRYRKQRATPSSEKTKARMDEAAKFTADMVIPQTPMDAGLMLIPGGKIARKAGAALIALDASDAEAGPLTKLLKAFHGARKPIDGIFNVEKASESSIMGKGLNVSTDPSYPSKWSMRPGSEAPTVYETAIPVDKYIQLDATYPPEAFEVLRKMRGRNPLPEGQVTGEQVYQTLRGIPQTLIPDTVLKSGYKGIEYPAQDGGRWFSIYDTEGVKDRLGKKFAKGGSVSVYDPDQVDAIANQFM